MFRRDLAGFKERGNERWIAVRRISVAGVLKESSPTKLDLQLSLKSLQYVSSIYYVHHETDNQRYDERICVSRLCRFLVQSTVIPQLINRMIQQENLADQSTILKPHFQASLKDDILLVS